MSQAPGVYVKLSDTPMGPQPIEAVGTSTTAFVGVAPLRSEAQPPAALAEPTRITRFEQYQRRFGGIAASKEGTKDYLGFSVRAFFDNGGREAYVVAMESNATDEEYVAVFATLEKFRDIDIICLPNAQLKVPGEVPPSPSSVETIASDEHLVPESSVSSSTERRGVISAAIAHAENMQDRIVLVDPTFESIALADSINETESGGLPSTSHAAFYYPWLEVSNPSFDSTSPVSEDNPRDVFVPPSGFVAGVWSRTDSRRGVWKAPAGVQARLYNLIRVREVVGDGEQANLNPAGVNCIRQRSGYGTVVWGSRTLATKAEPQWRYVPVRRTALMLKESIQNGIQWAVFEPNDEALWSSLRLSIDSFMNGLFRAGAFQGKRASQAYFVRCGLGDTMEQDDIDRGFVKVLVGFAPLKPAEFVEVTIHQQVNLQQGD